MGAIISAKEICYYSQSGRQIINSLSFAFGKEKVGMIGRNGVGKSTLLDLLAGRLVPDKGTCKCDGQIAYIPQIIPEKESEELWRMREEIKTSAIYSNDSMLRKMILERICSITPATVLSGGEQKLLHIMLAFSQPNSDFIMLDEPESNLDIENRRFLKQLIKSTSKGVLLVSHDGNLLNAMDIILEFREQGIRKFSGDFEQYKHIVSAEVESLNKSVRRIEKDLYILREMQSKSISNQLYRMNKAADEMSERRYGDFWCDTPKKDRAARTLKRLKKLYTDKEVEGRKAFEDYIDRATLVNKYSLPVPEVQTDPMQSILEVLNCSFSYTKEHQIIRNFSMFVHQGEKIALIGRNGIGKTTLLKLIIGELKGVGDIIRCWNDCVYLDQFLRIVDTEKSLIQNIKHSYATQDISAIEHYIRSMGYPEPQAGRKMKNLSGGELVIAELLFLFWRKDPPDILLLDEPVNHLDLSGVNLLVNLINSYKGAAIIVSHDENFLSRIEGVRVVNMESMKPMCQ